MIIVSTPKYKVAMWDNVGLCGFNHVEKYEFVNGKDDIPYIMENKSHVPNHQPDLWLCKSPKFSDQLHGFCRLA